jgi:hypothetical protein
MSREAKMTNQETSIKTYSSSEERDERASLTNLLKCTPLPNEQLLSNLGLYLSSKDLARILFMDFLYRKIIDVSGVVMEFGSRWGQNLALFAALRGIYDPFNRHRAIIGFDTFAGFPSVHEKDGNSNMMYEGNLALTENYQTYLEQVLTVHEQLNPLAHLKKIELRAGDACVEIHKFLVEKPQTIVALAFFDFDLYEPTKQCLQAILPRLTKGSIIGFDELNDPDSPGETIALMECLGLNNIRLKRHPYASRVSYFEFE